MPLKDSQRVELLLPAHMMRAVVKAGAQINREPFGWRRKWRRGRLARYYWHVGTADEWFAYEQFLQCLEYLDRTLKAGLSDLLASKANSILRRIERLHYSIIEPFLKWEIKTGESVTPKIGLVTFYLLQILVDDGWIVFGEDTDFQRALDIYLPAIEHVAAVERRDLSAQDQARKIYERLQAKELLYRDTRAR